MMTSEVERAAQYWDEMTFTHGRGGGGQFWWQAGPTLHSHINRKVSGDPAVNWVAHTLQTAFRGRLPLDNCLSLGCGRGNLERELADRNAFRHCDAYDLSEAALREARLRAEQDGHDNIAYHQADINRLRLPPSRYDAVWFHNALYHLEQLEAVYLQVERALKPGGLLILNEYIGPNRLQFSARQKEIANICLRLLPERYRLPVQAPCSATAPGAQAARGPIWYLRRAADKIQDGDFIEAVRRRLAKRTTGRASARVSVRFPSERDVVATDPSEAVRSAEIVDLLQIRFEILERKDWGGNIVQFLLAGIAGNFSEGDPQSQRLLRMILNVEETLLACGELQSDYAFIVAQPKGRAGGQRKRG